MAKKQATDAAANAAPPDAERPEGAKAEKGAEGKGAKGEKKAKGKPAADKGDKQSPAAPAPDAAPAGAAPSAPGASAPSPEQRDGGKKKGRPGVPPARGKKLRNQIKNQQQRVAKEGPTTLPKAIGLLKQFKRSKFDETVEVHVSLGVDTTQADQLVRGTVPLPHGLGKSVRVVVFSQGDNVEKAKAAGADAAGGDDLIKRVQDGFLEFDVALATQDMMGKVSRLGKVLGPRGLMPTPKAGTVITGDVANAIKEFKAGKVEYRTDKGGNVHAGVGKLSFDETKLVENIQTFIDAIRASKPSGVKGHYVKSVTVTSTMGPGIPVTA